MKQNWFNKETKIKNWEIIVVCFVWFLIGVVILTGIAFYYDAGLKFQTTKTLGDDYYLTDCNNLTLRDTALCLGDYVDSIYKFRENRDMNVLTLEELKEQGGDCMDYSRLYMKMGSDLGFEVDYVPLRTHIFVIMSNDDGYCKLDMTDVSCFLYSKRYEGGEKE